ncbi:MAG: hypothetical protein SFU27_08585 [Thermonemataceae bacterium]|nr:hypothetical protein [Thermonemataceae bacterium]
MRYLLIKVVLFFLLGLSTISLVVAQDTIWHTENGKRFFEIYKGENNQTPKYAILPRIEFGFNTLGSSVYPIQILKSRFWSLGLQYRRRLGAEAKGFSIGVGAEASWNNLHFSDNQELIKGNSAVERTTLPTEATRNKLTIFNIGIPVLFYKTLPKWRFGLGSYADIGLSRFTEIRYELNGQKQAYKNFSDFYTNTLRYGIRAEVKYKIIRIFAKYDINTLFQSGKADNNPRIFTFGIGL